MTTKPVTKRLASLDAMRGIAILFMIPFHILLFGQMMGGAGGGLGGIENAQLFVVDFNPPLGTGLILFFFVTGMSVAVSLARRRERQSPLELGRHLILRYGNYALIGVLVETIFMFLLGGTLIEGSFVEILQEIIFGFGISGPIVGLGLGAILSFPLILYLPWKKLMIAAAVLASLVGVVLYSILPVYSFIPPISIITFLYTGLFSLLKGLPMILLGAAVGKLVLDGRDFKKIFIIVGSVITAAYIIIPTLLGTGMLHVLMAAWVYPHAIIFIVGMSLLMFSFFHILETRKTNLTAIKVLGRSSFYVYYGHFIIFFAALQVIGFGNLSMGLMFGLMIVITAIIWTFFYFYSKWRWGPPSKW